MEFDKAENWRSPMGFVVEQARLDRVERDLTRCLLYNLGYSVRMNKATAKQVAYLSYLGVRNTELLSISEASDRIERLHQRAKHPCFTLLQSKIDDW